MRCSEQAKMIGISIAVLQPIRTIASVAKATASPPNFTDLAVPNACEVSPRVKPRTVGSRTPFYKLSTCVLVWRKMAADNSGSVTIREIMTAPIIAGAATKARA